MVTIVFSDLKGSTNLGEALDSESLREVMSRYFDEMRSALEQHGGTVEKYIGDAVMAVFGLPRLHEDDALRAVRAAASMQEALANLNVELRQRWGVTLTNRTGVNTGETVAGDPSEGQRLVTGDAVNVAARLEQAAPANEILIGDPTYRLVRNDVQVEEVEPLELKGKSERVPAYRLLGVSSDGARAQSSGGALIGREAELGTLKVEFERAVSERSCRSVTLVAEAGVGKSRLVEEFARGVGASAEVLRGRCLSYGRGITFWPIVEIVRHATGIREDDPPERARRQIASMLDGAADAAEQVAAAAGLSEREFPLEELFWGVRKLLENMARRRPLVVLFEDVHWAELTLLDLIEHVAVSSSDAPMLILCTARPFDEERPGWALGADSARIDLGALSAEDTALVVSDLLGGSEVADEVTARVVEASEGNPLFVEQMIAMLVDDELLRREDGRWEMVGDLAKVAVPPSINALLAARLDLLSAEERAVVEPASVIGAVFVTEAVEAIVPEAIGGDVARHLQALVRKRFITRNPAADSDSGFRFHHILVREAAYQGMLKRRRASLHEQYADWADAVNRDRERAVEYEEIQGYHLEQAHQYLSELGPLDDHGRELGLRAGIRLSSAGRRAFGRGDMPAAANLLRRAASLFPEEDERRVELLPSLGEAMMEIGEFAWGELFLDEAVERADHAADTRLLADALLTRLVARSFVVEDVEGWSAEVVSELDRLIPALERVEAHAELAKAWRLLGFVHGSVCRWSEQVDAHRNAIEHARRAGNARLEARLTAEYANGLRDGRTPVDEAIVECEAALERGLVGRQAEALVRCSLARLRATQGDFAEARELIAEAARLRDELGANLIVPVTSLHSSRVETLAGDLQAAERDLRIDFEKLSSIGAKYSLPLVGVLLARALCRPGRYREAAELNATVEQLADDADVETQAIRRCVSAQILVAEAGDPDEAEGLAREALEIVDSESPDLRGDCLMVLAEILTASGRSDEARLALREAYDLYTLKGNVVSADRALSLESELLPSAANA